MAKKQYNLRKENVEGNAKITYLLNRFHHTGTHTYLANFMPIP
jgi:hypothetical protein